MKKDKKKTEKALRDAHFKNPRTGIELPEENTPMPEEWKEDEISDSSLAEIEQFIRKEAQNMKIPESLEPENIQKVLESSRRSIKIKRYRHFAAAAAAFILILTGSSLLLNGGLFHAYQTNDGQMPQRTENRAGLPGDALQYAESYEAVEAGVREAQKRQKDTQHSSGLFDAISSFVNSGTKDGAPEGALESGASADFKQNISYSTTNIQTEGVDEADITKTDGKFIYRLQGNQSLPRNSQTLEIVSANKGKLKKTGTFTFDTENQITEFYLYQNMAIAIAQGFITTPANSGKAADISGEEIADACAPISTDQFTQILFIDIQDKEHPTKIGELTQSGYYVQSRLSEGYLYMVTGEDALIEYDGKSAISIPCVESKKVPADHILIPEGTQNTAFTTIASVDLKNIGQYADSRSILTSPDDFYMSQENIYLYNTKYIVPEKKATHYTNRTEITKFHYSKGKLSGKAAGEIEGSIKDSFAINEYNGKLRVVTSVKHSRRDTITDTIRNVLIGYQDNTEKEDNSVYVLDENLSVLGSITGIAENERVYSARFQGDIGYFVTYKETDPLFSVDFSDPEKPKLIGELKLPGFSEYLHFYSDTLLLGIGESGNGNIKLSMFDISDPANVKETDKYVLKDMESSPALYNYRSVLIDPDKNIIGFSGEIWTESNYDVKQTSHYDLFSWNKNKGFTRILKHLLNHGQEYSMYENSRGIYIGNTLYVVEYYGRITAYNLKTGQKIGTLK